MAKQMDLNRDFKEFIQLLNAHEVRYLIVGGYAVALHGYPRNTKDIDIWLWLDADNAKNLLKVLNDFGFGSLGLAVNDFLVPDQIIQLGYPPARIDLITSLPGVEFELCYEARIKIQIDNLVVNFIDLESLKQNKRASARPQDIADLANLG
jgi:hypothetical protein